MPKLPELEEQDIETLFEGLDAAIDKAWLDKIWAMLTGRMKMYEDIRG